MGEPSHFLSRFFKVFSKTAGKRKSKACEREDEHAKNPDLPDEIHHQFSVAEIKAATYNFDENLIIGKGGFGNVYKGIFNDENLIVAVKRLYPEALQGFNEFQTEALLLSQLRHPNLVSLLGFCYENDEMILVYEYISNRSLNYHLYGTDYDPLPWKKRLQICVGAARGLHYLHTGVKQAVIHRDIKSNNILLDDNWDCKLCDLGLSKLRSRNKAKALKKINSAVKGTWGYLDPEYARGGGLTEKSDVYSFGVVLFEVLCARKALDVKLSEGQKLLPLWAHKCIEQRTIHKIIDPYLMGKIAPECFKIFVDAAFCCTNVEGNIRPDIGEVEVMLELALEVQEKADSNHMSPHGEYVLQQVSFAAIFAKYPVLPEGKRQFSLAEIKAATNKFDANLIIGIGGFGNVYKGFFNNGSLVIAVKRLRPESTQGVNELRTEVPLLSQLRHQHLVSLLGFCYEDDEMVLVYEYMSNGSLYDHLHYGTNNDSLPWKKRLQICIGAARGLHYLHTGAKQAIVHRKIKSRNILLDDNWDCKLCDFGLSKLRSRNDSKALKKIESKVKESRGYLASEYARRSVLTEKSDVFSFGVVLFEVLCARKALDPKLPQDQVCLFYWVFQCMKRGIIYNIIDPYLMGKIAPECFKIYVDIAFCCINMEGNRRPDMGEVEVMLELALEMQEKADSDMDHLSPNSEYEYEQVSFAALFPKHPSN